MPVKVRCSSCDKVLTVPDAARGKAVKCPQCNERITVPTGDSQITKAAEKSKKKPTAKENKPVDSEDALASLDLRRAEDANARICSKCGFDMGEMDEEETECPKCGFDIESGGLGVKARKKQMKGPDPADFFPGLAKGAWSFVFKNQMLAWRTAIYSLVPLLISMVCAFLYLYISAWPPRVFFALCFFVAFLVIPGWLWYLDTEIIKLTLERKDKFKKLNFDFFLASSKGVILVAWLVVGAGPILLPLGGLGYYLVNYNGQPEWMMGVCIGIGLIPVIWMLPVVMAHMTMPISMPGWMFWKVIQFWGRSIGGASMWFLWFVITSLPLAGGAAAIGAVWGNDIVNLVQTMESNADISRRILAAENAPKGKNAQPVDLTAIGKPVDIDLKPLIGPCIILSVMCFPLGFIGMFNMRTNGQFVYYFKERLELIDKAKEYKYVAKKRKSEDDDDEPVTLQKDLTDGLVIAIVFALVGGVGGMLYGSLTSAGLPKGISFGVLLGTALGLLFGLIRLMILAFDGGGFSWERTRKLVFEIIGAIVIALITVGVFLSMGETFTLPQ
ncbi:MAG: hypothetical protein U0941_30300 [Planctomycetaceae bacterium]